MKDRLAAKLLVVALSLGTSLGLLNSPAKAQVASTVYSFGATGDGAYPYPGLIMDASGNLYGTTGNGGTSNVGTVFELVNSSGTYTEKVLYSFAGGSDGANPYGTLLLDASGNLYGTTEAGGTNFGTVFELVNSSGAYTEKVLYSFAGGSDGANPYAGLIIDATGNLYGTTSGGGTSSTGTVFELVNSSGNYTEKVLYTLAGGSDGANPYDGLIMDAAGNLYGTTNSGGTNGAGTVFELANSSGTYTEKVLYSFTNTNIGGDGANPLAGLVMDASGNLYGTTQGGGTNFGTVFELVNSSGTYTEKVLYRFTNTGGDGAYPIGGFIMDAAGNLYGTTGSGGTKGSGTVFELSNSSGIWTESLLLIFGTSCEGSGTSNGANPSLGNLLMDTSGNLYGTTVAGGANSLGTVFSITHFASPNATTASLVSSPNPVGAGFPVSFTATVSSSNGFPTGTVVLSNSLGTVGTSGPLVCGAATVNFDDALTLGIGTTAITATFKPAGPDYSSSVAVMSQTVNEPGVVLTNGNNTLTGNDTIAGTVSATNLVGNGAGLTGVNASGLNCTACVGNSQLAIDYAGSATQGGPATNALMLQGFLPSAFQPAGSYVFTSSVGVPSGVASLDATGKVPAAQLPSATTGSSTPTILTGWCSGVAASANGSTFGFAGLGDPTTASGTTCSNGTGSSTVIGIPVTSPGTLKNLHVYPGAAGSSGTSITFTIYTASAPGWSATSGPNQATISALSFRSSSDNVTLTVSPGGSFAAGDSITVSGIAGTYNAGTNCTSLAGSLFDGTFTVSSSTATAVAYVDHSLPTNCGRNISGASATGTVADNTNTTANFVTRTAPTATALGCTIGAPSTSAAVVCSDTSHTVSVNAGDVISVVATSARTSGTETIGNIRVSVEKQ